MNKLAPTSVKDTIELIGIAAVVLSLLLVAYEVRQSNRIAQATTTYEIGRDINQFNELGYSDPEFAELLLKLRDEQFEPSGLEVLQINLLARRFINIWTTQETAYANGLLTEVQFAATQVDVVTIMQTFPVLNRYWESAFHDQPALKSSAVLQPIVNAQ
ncbi:MAG: hypothetical protein AAFY29_04100 [Pseudomonadota bacterium]